MDLIRAFAEFAADFEKTYADDDWSRLERYFHDDAVYRVENSPFACELRGRQEVLAGLKRSLDGFDRRCDARALGAIAPPRLEGETITVDWAGSYRLSGIEPLEISGKEIVRYRGDRIASLVDRYKDDDARRFADWIARCGRPLDASYAPGTQVVEVYHAARSRSTRIIWLLEELGDVPYRVIEKTFLVPLDGLFAQDTPSGKFPTLVHGELVMFESGAIVQYLLDRFGRGRLQPPINSDKRGPYYQWLHFAESTGAIPPSLMGWYGVVKRDDSRFHPALDEMRSWAKDTFAVLEEQFGDGPYVLGDFTAADIMLGYTLQMASVFGLDFAELPRLRGYLSTLLTRPALQKALSGAGAFDQ